MATAAGDIPVFLGSGVSADNIASFLPFADGFIVGTSLKIDGQTRAAVDRERVRRLMDALKG